MDRIRTAAAALAAIMLAAPATGALAQPAKAKPKAATAGKTAGHAARAATLGGHPNLNGIWQVLNTADWDLAGHDAKISPAAPETLGALTAVPPGLGVIEGDAIPYLPAAREQLEANRKAAPKGDPEAACYLPGIPRATYMPHPFQIIQGANGDMLMAYQYAAANRLIKMQKVEVPPIDTWMGTSYGNWEGNTLRVVTLAQNGMSWLDRVGDYLGSTTTVTERFTPMDADHIKYDVTISDPMLYSRDWKMSMVLYRHVEPRAQLLDFRCVDFAELLVYGDLLENKSGK